jgi:rhamnose transport system ATP-binding protein
MPQPIVELAGVAKSFGGVQAVKEIDLAIDAGQIVGLVGENGAGKSTVIKLLSGVHPPDRGTIKIAGREVRFASPKDALEAGVTTIQQELTCFAHLSIAENLLMGEAWPRQKWGGVDWPALNAEANRRLTGFGLSLETHRTLGELTAAEKQEIAIAGALARPARFVILDEPTASLTEPEVKRLFSHLRRLRSQGVTILYVSHRLDEIFELTDRIIVMRDGSLVASHRTAEVDAPRLVHDMVGRPLEQVYPRTRTGRLPPADAVARQSPAELTPQPLLELSGVTRSGMFRNVSLTLRAGEIVGLAGLVGAGRSELARAIYGLYRIEAGTMRLRGRDWRPAHPRESLRAGLVYVPEERKRQGLVLEHSLAEAIGIGFSDRLTRFGLIPARAQRRRVAEAIKTYDIRAGNARQAIATLSGGNQQKALLARWLERGPEVVILDEPTRGVDVGAKSQIHALVDSLAAKGKGILFISSDLGEIVGMSDRILVMNRGTIETELCGEQMTAHNVILAASGLYQPAPSGRTEGGTRQEHAPS